MKFRIHYEIAGHEDSLIVEADTIDEIRKIAHYEIERRGATNPWSEVIE